MEFYIDCENWLEGILYGGMLATLSFKHSLLKLICFSRVLHGYKNITIDIISN